MRLSAYCSLLLGIPLLQVSQNTGIAMTVRTDFGPTNSSEQTTYWQPDRERTEHRSSLGRRRTDGSQEEIYGPRIATIARCDLGQTFNLNLDSGEYDSGPYPPNQLAMAQLMSLASKMPPQTAPVEKPTVRIETTTVDTGERMQMFGRMARHVVTTRKEIPLEDSQRLPQESVTDGWYIDLDQRLSCGPRWPEGTKAHSFSTVAAMGAQPVDRPEFIDIGDAKTGFALRQVDTTIATIPLPDGSVKHTESKFEREVTQFQEGPLDPSLFEIPAGFRLVDHVEQNPTLATSSNR